MQYRFFLLLQEIRSALELPSVWGMRDWTLISKSVARIRHSIMYLSMCGFDGVCFSVQFTSAACRCSHYYRIWRVFDLEIRNQRRTTNHNPPSEFESIKYGQETTLRRQLMAQRVATAASRRLVRLWRLRNNCHRPAFGDRVSAVSCRIKCRISYNSC